MLDVSVCTFQFYVMCLMFEKVKEDWRCEERLRCLKKKKTIERTEKRC